MNNTFEEIWASLLEAKRIIMSLHYGPDGDSLGSCVAMRRVLEKEGKEVILLSRDKLDDVLMHHEFAKDIRFGEELAKFDYQEGDIMLLLDAGVQKQILPEDYKFPENNVIVIDHHATNTGYGKMNYVDSGKVSTASLLLEMFKTLNIEIDKEIAEKLMIGIYTDSGFFSHSSDSIGEAAFLLEKGIDYIGKIVDPIKYGVPLKVKKLQGKFIQNFKEIKVKDLKVGYSTLSLKDMQELGVNHSDVRGGINYLMELRGYDVIFTLFEISDLIKGSFRTRKMIDVSKYAQAMEGGGHKKAAAFKLPKMPLEEAEKKVLEVIEKVGVHNIEEGHTGR
jgi:phosphoesterase RecJ-like protein